MNQLSKLAGQTGIYGMSSIVGRLLNYLLVPLYTNIFSRSEYGTVTELYAYTGFLMVIFLYGFETAYFRFSEKEGHSRVFHTAFTSVILSTLALTGALVFMAPAINSWLGYSGSGNYITLFAFIIALDVISAIPFARLRQEGKALRFGMLKLTNIAVNIFLNLFFLLLCPVLESKGYRWVSEIYDPSVGIGYIFISNLAASAVTILMLLPEILKARFSIEGALWRRMMAYAFPLLVAGAAGMINETFDRMMLRHLINHPDPLSQLGIYGACYKLSVIMTLFVQAFRYAAEPFFFSVHGKKDDLRLIAESTRYFTLFASLVFLSVMLFLDVVKYFIGENFHEGLRVVPVLLMANLFLGLYFNLSVWYKLTDKTYLGSYIAVGGAVITIVLNIILIPLTGYMGSAWATLVCYFFMAAASWFMGRKVFPVPYDLVRIGGYIFLAAALFGVSETFVFAFEPSFSVKMIFSTFLLILFLGAAFAAEQRQGMNRFR